MLLLYENIKKRREELGMSKAHLADLIGYDRSMITKIEQGKVDLTQSKIIAFADALQTTPCWLMGWDEQTNKPQISLSPHENKVITAYRNQPDTQPFVDRLLGIANESTESPVHKVAIAAFGGNGVEIRKLTDEQYQKTRVLKSKLKYKTSGNDLD